MGEVISLIRQKIYQASDGETFTTEEELRVYESRLRTANALAEFWTKYELSPETIQIVVSASLMSAPYLSQLLGAFDDLE